MYCNHCGASISPEQAVCSGCGTSITGARADMAARTRVAAHVNLLAILWCVLGAMHVLCGICLLGLSGFVRQLVQNDSVARSVAPAIIGGMAVFILATAALKLIAAWGLYQVLPWGRGLALVVAFLSILDFPLGTGLGVFTLVVLLPAAAGDEYQKMSTRRQGSAQGGHAVIA